MSDNLTERNGIETSLIPPAPFSPLKKGEKGENSHWVWVSPLPF